MRTRTKTLLSVVGLLGLAAPAAAQTGAYYGPPGANYGPGGYGGAVAPGYGGPSQGSPLSPYLNILGGTRNPAINYYNFTRPALQAGGYYGPPAATMGANPFARQPFFPPGNLQEYANETPPTEAELKAMKNHFAPTGHPAGFNDYLGYFGGTPRGGALGATGRTTGLGAGNSGTRGRPIR